MIIFFRVWIGTLPNMYLHGIHVCIFRNRFARAIKNLYHFFQKLNRPGKKNHVRILLKICPVQILIAENMTLEKVCSIFRVPKKKWSQISCQSLNETFTNYIQGKTISDILQDLRFITKNFFLV